MSALTNDAENLLLAWAFTTGTALRPASWEVALHTADPTETGAVAEVVVGDFALYARQAVTMGTPTSGQTLSTSTVSWTLASGDTGFTATHASIWDVTNSICLIYAGLLVPRIMVGSGVLTFNIGEIIAALD